MRVPVAGLMTFLAAAVLAAMPAAARSEEAGQGSTDKITQQIDSIQERLLSLQNDEIELSMKLMQMQQKALEGVENPGKAAEELAKGSTARGLGQYKATMIACAGQVQSLDRRLFPLLKSVQGLKREREDAPKEVQARIDDIANRVESKHRANMEKVAGMYEQVAEYKSALGIYLSIFKELTEADRA